MSRETTNCNRRRSVIELLRRRVFSKIGLAAGKSNDQAFLNINYVPDIKLNRPGFSGGCFVLVRPLSPCVTIDVRFIDLTFWGRQGANAWHDTVTRPESGWCAR